MSPVNMQTGLKSLLVTPSTIHGASNVFNYFADTYGEYADRRSAGLFSFEEGGFSEADSTTWNILCQFVRQIMKRVRTQEGRNQLRILDMGCGSGTWLIRLACAFVQIDIYATGMDPSARMIELTDEVIAQAARDFDLDQLSEYLRKCIRFKKGDFRSLEELEDSSFDLSLSLYSPLNHVPVTEIPDDVKNLLRVTKFICIASFCGLGSPPTVYACKLEEATSYKQDGDFLWFKHKDGSDFLVESHLFTFGEVKSLFGPIERIVDCVGLDIFLSRFRCPSYWVPQTKGMWPNVEHLELQLCRNPAWIDWARQVLAVVAPKGNAKSWRNMGLSLKPVMDRLAVKKRLAKGLQGRQCRSE